MGVASELVVARAAQSTLPVWPVAVRGPAAVRRRARAVLGALTAAALVVVGGLGAVSCADSDRRVSDATLAEFERLAFVPAGQISVATPGGNLLLQVREPLLFDRFEVRREDWLSRAGELGPAARELAEFVAGWDPSERDRPVTFVTQGEAQQFAQLRRMRLPTAGEWIFVCSGPQRLPYPWGPTAQRGVANTLELELGQLSPCGAFESGRSALGVYDLHGNAAEWTDDLAPTPDRRGSDSRVSGLGGSFRTYSRPLLVGGAEPLGRVLARHSRADDLGFRCCAPAAAYLRERAPAIALDGPSRARLRSIGHRWGRRALPLLSELATTSGAAPALRVLAEGAAQ